MFLGAGSTDPYYKGPKPMEHIIKVPTTVYTSNDSTFAVNGQALVPSPSLGGFSKSQFTYEELARATSGFSKANLLGQGGFGYVHKGVLVDGTVVAVKSLKSGSGQGEREFQAEVDIISRVHHRHLVSLVGYCIADRQRMLVYEYVPNKTLEFHLHGTSPVTEYSLYDTLLKYFRKSLYTLASIKNYYTIRSP